MYALNPNSRVYSHHSFYRAGIAYQILNGFIPPRDCLFAGEPLHSPWGYPFLVACVSKVLNVTPFYSFAITNIISIILVIWLVFAISRLLIDDQRANVFSVIISIFGISIFGTVGPKLLFPTFNNHLEFRATPAFTKFTTSCGDPVGLVLFFLFVYSIIKLFRNDKIIINSILFAISILGCGFIYPPMFPAVVFGTVAVCLGMAIMRKRNHFVCYFRRIVLISIILVSGILLLIPYWSVISSGVRQSVDLFDFRFVLRNLTIYLFWCLPIVVIIILNRKFLKSQLCKQPLIILSIIIVATAFSYIFVHLLASAEYKFLMLSTVSLGIFGGVAFYFMSQWCNRVVVFVLLLLFTIPSIKLVLWRVKSLRDIPISYTEKGIYIYSTDTEENELYEWIRNNTPIDSIFIDTELNIPIFAQRSLFIGMDKVGGDPTIGYTTNRDKNIDVFLKQRHGHNTDLVNTRRSIVKYIYDRTEKVNIDLDAIFGSQMNIYIVDREKYLVDKIFIYEKFDEVFKSSQGNLCVYQRRL
jgi:hypothetical protein